jgi:hypothetical protein
LCNLYSFTKGQQAIREITRAMIDQTGRHPLAPTSSKRRVIETGSMYGCGS